MENKTEENQEIKNTIPQQQQQQKHCMIFIGDLDESLDENYITVVFHRFGPIKSVVLRKDTMTNQSKGYCFIEYSDEESAQKAIKEANGMIIGRKHVRVVQYKNPRELNTEANIFMSKLDKDISNSELHEYFAKFGNVLSINLKIVGGQNLGYGYIQFEKPEEADAVVKQTSHTINNKQVELCKFVARNKRDDVREKKSIYITNIPDDEKLSQDEKKAILKKTYEAYGQIHDLNLGKDDKNKQFYSFVTFEKQESAEAAIAGTNDKDIFKSGSQVNVAFPFDKNNERDTDQSDANLYSKNIKLDVTEQQFKKAFEQYGKITFLKLKKQSPIMNRYQQQIPQVLSQFASIYYERKEDAQKAQIDSYNNKDIQQLYLHNSVFITILQTKEDRQNYVKDTNKKPLTLNSSPFSQNPFSEVPFMPQQFPPMGGFQVPFGGFQQQPFYNNYKRQGGNNYNNNRQQQPYQKKYNSNQQQQNPQQYNNRKPYSSNNQNQRQNNNQQKTDVEGLIQKLENQAKLGQKEKQEVWKYLGTQIYPKVNLQVGPEKAGKITGMLVDLETYSIREIVETMHSHDQLSSQIKEAMTLLDQAQKAEQ